MRRALLRVVALAGVLLAAGSATAQTLAAQVLRESDANGDGKLQRSEAPIELLPHFADMDQDHDGAIDSYEAWNFDTRAHAAGNRPAPAEPAKEPTPTPVATAEPPPQTLVELLARADRNGDHRLSPDEVPAALRDRLLDLDPNGDGAIDEDEARVLDARRSRSAGEAAPRQRSLVRTVHLMDTDGDGRLQKREAPLRLQPVFERIDVNADGAIDVEEAARFDASVASDPSPRR
jgi:Ca2+-binding EF-hand superfamily protein